MLWEASGTNEMKLTTVNSIRFFVWNLDTELLRI